MTDYTYLILTFGWLVLLVLLLAYSYMDERKAWKEVEQWVNDMERKRQENQP